MFTSFTTFSAQIQDHRDRVIADARRFRRPARPEPVQPSQPQRPVLRLLDAKG
jgi:hypothetical protein